MDVRQTITENRLSQTPKHKSDEAYLEAMRRYAEKLLAYPGYAPQEWAERGRYVRINGNGLRPVSIAQENPCGALHVTRTERKTNVGAQKTTQRLAAIMDSAGTKSYSPADGKALWLRKKELRVQAWIISKALIQPDELPGVLCLDDACDELRFVTDELALNKIRADVVLLGRKGTEWFPVFVELKADRHREKVLSQLNNILDLATSPRLAEPFRAFLGACAREPAESIRLERAERLMIWPSLPNTTHQLDKSWPAGVRVIEFDRDVFCVPPAQFTVKFRQSQTRTTTPPP